VPRPMSNVKAEFVGSIITLRACLLLSLSSCLAFAINYPPSVSYLTPYQASAKAAAEALGSTATSIVTGSFFAANHSHFNYYLFQASAKAAAEALGTTANARLSQWVHPLGYQTAAAAKASGEEDSNNASFKMCHRCGRYPADWIQRISRRYVMRA
jgi:hypothetical protein